MPVVLICAPDSLTDELHKTLLWRSGIDRYLASSFQEALITTVATHPDLVVVDRDLPQAHRLVENLRATRKLSIAVVARGDFNSAELQLLEAGANAILRLPAGPEWDERLARLIQVAPRRSVRVGVSVDFEATTTGTVERVWGRLVDVSVSGMLIECSTAALKIGAEIGFSFRLPDSQAPVVGSGRIVRLARPGRYGVEFSRLEGDAGEQVRIFAEAQEPPRVPR